MAKFAAEQLSLDPCKLASAVLTDLRLNAAVDMTAKAKKGSIGAPRAHGNELAEESSRILHIEPQS